MVNLVHLSQKRGKHLKAIGLCNLTVTVHNGTTGSRMRAYPEQYACWWQITDKLRINERCTSTVSSLWSSNTQDEVNAPLNTFTHQRTFPHFCLISDIYNKMCRFQAWINLVFAVSSSRNCFLKQKWTTIQPKKKRKKKKHTQLSGFLQNLIMYIIIHVNCTFPDSWAY